MHRTWILAVAIVLGGLAGCEPAPSPAPGEPAGSAARPLVDAAGDALRAARTATGALPEPDGSAGGEIAAITSRITGAGAVAAATAPYVYARECGASEAQLDAYKRAARAQLQKLPTFSAADFQADFDAGVRLMARQARLDHGPLDEARRAGRCQWAFDVIARADRQGPVRRPGVAEPCPFRVTRLV